MKKLLTSLALAALLLTGCGASTTPNAQPSAGTPAATKAPAAAGPTQTVGTAPEPSGIATTGAYEADVLALGITPDDMASYKDFMIGNACEDTGTALGISVRSIGRGTPKNGGGPDILLLTATYFCPAQLPEIEKHLEYFDQ